MSTYVAWVELNEWQEFNLPAYEEGSGVSVGLDYDSNIMLRLGRYESHVKLSPDMARCLLSMLQRAIAAADPSA